MKHFQDVLEALGAENGPKLLKETNYWEFWQAEYITPVSTVYGHYLYLKSSCPLKEATPQNVQNWKELSSRTGYNLIVTPSSPLALNYENTKKHFCSLNVMTSKELLMNNLLKGMEQHGFEPVEHFITPDIRLENGETKQDALDFLKKWLLGSTNGLKSTAIAILTAHGGIGKTTVARKICADIKSIDSSVIPLLIESEQWKHMNYNKLSMEYIWNEAISRRFVNANRLLSNKKALRALINSGLCVVIFDGFDELCGSQLFDFGPQDIIDSLVDVAIEDDGIGQARILLTSRETYWETVKDGINKEQIEVYKLKGFDQEQRKKYFEQRLKNPVERDTALRLSKEIGGAIYDTVEEENEDRLSGVPFILALIAHYVEGCDVSSSYINPYMTDPLEPLLEDMCRRENSRQELDIDPTKQLLLFEELFREFQNKDIPLEYLRFCLEYFCSVTDPSILMKFTSHHFLIRTEKDMFAPRYDVLRVYFIARFLAKGLSGLYTQSERSKIARTLALNSTGKTQVIDWLVKQLGRMEDDKLCKAFNHAFKIIDEQADNSCFVDSGKALFNVLKRFITDSDKVLRINKMLSYIGQVNNIENRQLNRIVITGLVRAFDFSGIKFKNCIFCDVEFKNCCFDAGTELFNSNFEGTVTFVNCEDESSIIIHNNCKMSKEAEYSWDLVMSKSIREDLKKNFAEDALKRALKKFKGYYGFESIQLKFKNKGFKAGNPYNDSVWDVLAEQKIVESHTISNVTGGGLNIVDDKELRREITAYLDNTVLGTRLRTVIDKLIS
ncbi:MAG: NACHT domain-containing protein [Trichlorobacter sp.]|uniref:NACHT domain-containing protein n=1 Tax=Trichlorobacter sp. TaxID=2911007 RepID=UPI00255E3853|nr:NACHT domain-containing protein [Trichlorobacter sp.]MDK9718013.1 NACHT domain-containing protein [Trichlorobacter sp.]